MMRFLETGAGRLIRSQALDGIPGIEHGFGVRGPDVAAYLDALGVTDRFIVATDQVHGNRVHVLFRPRKGAPLAGDAFISDRPGIVCFVRTADCVPILIADTKHPTVAAVHAGWRGTAADVAGATLRAMRETFGTNPADCIAAIGPRICGDCYEVGDEVIAVMEGLHLNSQWRKNNRNVDLGVANGELLKRAGLDLKNISLLPHCTSCNRMFASWRRDREEKERQFNFIMIRGQ